eukprot:gene5213-biopygen6213
MPYEEEVRLHAEAPRAVVPVLPRPAERELPPARGAGAVAAHRPAEAAPPPPNQGGAAPAALPLPVVVLPRPVAPPAPVRHAGAPPQRPGAHLPAPAEEGVSPRESGDLWVSLVSLRAFPALL